MKHHVQATERDQQRDRLHLTELHVCSIALRRWLMRTLPPSMWHSLKDNELHQHSASEERISDILKRGNLSIGHEARL